MASEEGSSDKVIPVRVVVRVRPLSAKEIREGCQECIDITHDSPQVTSPSPVVCALVPGRGEYQDTSPKLTSLVASLKSVLEEP